jgi:hypothetical protein
VIRLEAPTSNLTERSDAFDLDTRVGKVSAGAKSCDAPRHRSLF